MSHAAIIEQVRLQRLFQDNVSVATVAVLTYEYILTLHLEIKYLWSSKLTYTKVAFLLVRYIPLVASILVIYNQLAINVSGSVCSKTVPAEVWMLKITMMLSETILAVRTWAIWRRNKIVGVGLATVIVTFIVASCVFMAKFLNGLNYRPSPYPGYRGCVVDGDIRLTLLENSAMMSATQAVVLIFVVIGACRSYSRQRTSFLHLSNIFGNGNELYYVIYRDGIIFYVGLLCISIASLLVISILPVELASLLAPMEAIMYSVLATRTILNIRIAAERNDTSTTTELHSSYEPRKGQLSALVFQVPDL